MITKCFDKDVASQALSVIGGSVYIKNTILLYLNAYGTKYDFSEVFIQYDSKGSALAVVLRYNSFVYCSIDKDADFEELLLWLGGYKDTTIYCDLLPSDFMPKSSAELCFEMCCKGASIDASDVHLLQEPTLLRNIAKLINGNDSQSAENEYYLDLSYLLRHNCLKVFCYTLDVSPVSVAGVADITPDESVINFVFTDEHFRGNGYSKMVLKSACNNPSVSYRLLCSYDNLEFYKKCGFQNTDNCLKFNF